MMQYGRAYAGGNPGFDESGGGEMGWGGRSPWGGGRAYAGGGGGFDETGGRAYAGGSDTFDEAGNSGGNPWAGNDMAAWQGNGGAPMYGGLSGRGVAGPADMGGNYGTKPMGMPRQMGYRNPLSNALRAYGGRMGWQGSQDMGPGMRGDMGGIQQPAQTMGGVQPQGPNGPQPMGGVNGPQPMGAAPQQNNFGDPNQSGNSQSAINTALATGNQSGLAGAGSTATNSAINAAGPGQAGWNPGAVMDAYRASPLGQQQMQQYSWIGKR